MIDLARNDGLEVRLADLTLAEALDAEEAFVTGTMGGIAPVAAIDGRALPAAPGPLTARLATLYEGLKDAEATRASGAQAS